MLLMLMMLTFQRAFLHLGRSDIETFNFAAYFVLDLLPTLTMLVNRELLVNENNPDNKALHASLGSTTSRAKKNDYLALGNRTYITSKVTIYHL
jgi:hypothetical protein